MKTGIIILKVLLGLMGLTLVYNGFMWAFFPTGNLEANEIIANSTIAINMIKSDIGSPLLVAGAFLVLFAIQGRKWFLPTVMIAGSYFLVRTISFIIDSYHEIVITGIILEGVVIALACLLNHLLKKQENQKV